MAFRRRYSVREGIILECLMTMNVLKEIEKKSEYLRTILATCSFATELCSYCYCAFPKTDVPHQSFFRTVQLKQLEGELGSGSVVCHSAQGLQHVSVQYVQDAELLQV